MSYSDPFSPMVPRRALELSEMEEVSPVTDLANNLGDTSFGFTARRKLSLSEENSPHPKKVLALDPQVMMNSPIFDTPTGSSIRLVKTSLKCSAGGTPLTTQATKRVNSRRLCDSPNTNENLPPMEMQMQISPPKNFVPSPSKFTINKRVAGAKCRIPLEDQDTNSQDSGISFIEDGKPSSQEFRFAQPSGFAPRRLTQDSPRRSMASNLFSSSSSESNDDGFMDFIMPLQDDDNSMLPPGLSGLISEPIINNPNTATSSNHPQRPVFRRCISENVVLSSVLNEDSVIGKRPAVTNLDTPIVKRHKPLGDLSANIQSPTRGTLFDYGFKKLKSPLMDEQHELQQSPRLRHSLQHSISADASLVIPHRHKLKHSYSESDHDMIKSALARSIDEDLIGDLTRPFALPITNGTHQDMKYISCETLAKLIKGEFQNIIGSYEIIDCRYPYEYDGGHIKGAKNMYTRDQVMEHFIHSKSKQMFNLDGSAQPEKRNIVIFHCEFSSERGPTLSRFLRSEDRASNCYPNLNYPEMYLLHGGYKAFFTSHSDLCEPCAYRKMVDCSKEELQHFRTKSRTWSGDNKGRALKRAALRLVI